MAQKPVIVPIQFAEGEGFSGRSRQTSAAASSDLLSLAHRQDSKARGQEERGQNVGRDASDRLRGSRQLK